MPYHIDEENSELAFEVREGNKLVIKIKSNIFSDSLELYLIKVGDNTEPTDKNVFSSLRVLKEIENLHDTILKEINSVTSGFWELKQDSQGNEYISTKYNVLTEGGLTTYGLGEQKLGTIYDGLPIDNDTIYWEEVEGSRVLKAKGSGGGSTGLDETKLWNVLGTPGDQQIDYSHLRSAFSQFSNEFVTINTEQEITALKHFTAGLSIGSAKKKIYEKNGVLYIDSNVAITGALTMYATDGQSVSSIYDGLPIDNDTIYWETVEGSRVLKAKGSGGEAGSVQWGNISGKPTWIEDTKPTYNWYEIQGEKPFYTKEEVAAKFVTIDTEQDITALKHFTAGLSVGESKKKIYEENGVVYIDADVAVTGAMTFYASAGRSVSTIMDGVTVDEETITKGSDNVLRIKNAGAGSSFDENAMWSALSGSSDNQINKSHLTNALAGYATESWVTGKGYATESWVASKNYATTEALNAVSNKLNDFLEGSDADTIINKWKELEAFLSGMAETDNLAEILETKADKKYVDSTFVTLATKQTITGEKTFSSVLNTAAIKASGAITAPSLAASDWVTIAGIKLRKLEDGALMLEGNLALTGALTMYASNGQSFDTIYDGLPIDNDTIYWQEVDGSRVLKAREGSGSSFDKSAMWTALAGSTTEQINKSHLTTALTGYATESWVTSKNYLTSVSIATISDLHANWDALLKAAPSAYVTRWPTISEVTDRKNLIIKLNGGSTEGTNLFTYNVTGEKTINITPAGIGAAASSHNHSWSNITSGKPSTLSGYGITDAYTKTESDSKYPTKTGSGASGTWGINVTGNAGTATKLQTARSLWGNNFDGSSNVSGQISLGSNGIYWKETNFGDQFKIIPDFANVDDNNKLLIQSAVGGAGTTPTLTTKVVITGKSGNVGIGVNSPSTKLHVMGDILSSANVRATDSVYINSIRLYKSADGVITLEGNLAVTGGITTYAIDPVSASTVMDGVAVDGTTIAKVDGVLKVLNAGGGEAGSVAWGNITGKPSVYATNIANITDLHSSWDAVLKAQKPAWLTAVSIATISDLHANWDALLKAAPSAYVTRWPTISEVTGKQNLIVKLNGGTTEGTNQFTYNATGAKTINITPAGIGAAASSHNHSWSNITSGKPTTLAGYGITDGVNSVSVTGTGNAITSASISGHSLTLTKGNTFVLLKERNINTTNKGLWDIDKTNGGANCWNNPANAALQLQNNNNALAIIIDGNENGRMANIQVGHENTNYAANVGVLYLNRLGGDVYIGTTLAATINSNVASATKLQNTRYLWGVAFDGTKNIEGTLTIYSDNTFDVGTDACNFNSIYARVVRNTKARDMVITQDASAGLVLRTSATNRIYITSNGYVGINKNDPSFTLDVSGYIRAGLAHLGAIETNTYGTGKWTDTNMLSNATIKSVAYGAVAKSSAHCHIGWKDVISGVGYSTYYAIGSVRENSNWGSLYFAVGNNDAGTSAGCKLYLRGYGQAELIGNLLVTGGTTFYESDQRAKNIIGLVYLSLMQISEAPTIRFRWNGWHTKDDGRNHVGGIAQYIQGILPEAIINSDKSLSMDYATVAYTFAVHTARHLMNYETRTDKKIKKLENRVKYLEKQLKKLGYEEVRTLDDSGI